MYHSFLSYLLDSCLYQYPLTEKVSKYNPIIVIINASSTFNPISSLPKSHIPSMESSKALLQAEYRSYQRRKIIHPIPEYPNTNTPSVFVKPSIFPKNPLVNEIFPLGKRSIGTKFLHNNSTLTFSCSICQRYALMIGFSSQWKKVIRAHHVIMSRLFTRLATPEFSSP